MQVLDHGVEVEALEFLGIVERYPHRIGGRVARMQHADIEVLGPPVAVAVSAAAARERALAGAIVCLCVHGFLQSRFCNFLRVVRSVLQQDRAARAGAVRIPAVSHRVGAGCGR